MDQHSCSLETKEYFLTINRAQSKLNDNLTEIVLCPDFLPQFLFAPGKYNAQCQKTALMPYAGKEGPDQTARLRSLIWAFVARLQHPWILWTISTSREYPDHTARMRRLIWALDVRIR